MNKEVIQKKHNQAQRKSRIRQNLSGSAERPRLSLTISNRHVSAQLIDDTSSKTIASATTIGKKQTGNLSDQSAKVATELAKAAKAKKVESIVFDRNGKKYHGRVKIFADTAREGGLKF